VRTERFWDIAVVYVGREFWMLCLWATNGKVSAWSKS